MGLLRKFLLFSVVLMAVGFELMRRKMQVPINMNRVDMTGKRIIITGATAGIGEETARVLLDWGADVLIGARDFKKAAGVVDRLERSTGKRGHVEV